MHSHDPHDHSGEHDHDHHEHGHHHSPPASFDRAFAISISLNLLFVAVEAFYGWQAQSLALWADAAHNLSDVAGLVLAWGGVWAGRIPSDERYTYGFKRASLWAAFGNAMMILVGMGSLMWEAGVHLLCFSAAVWSMCMVVGDGAGVTPVWRAAGCGLCVWELALW